MPSSFSSRRPHAPSLSLSRILFILLGSMGIGAIAACGGAEAGAPANKAPAAQEAPAKEEPEPRSVEEAQAQIARLRSAMEDEAKKKSSDTLKAEERSTSPTSPSTSTTPGATSRQESLDACGNPCRALLSMKRAVDALCRMTGDGDNRCVDAKKTLTESTGRVSPCKCT